MGGALVWAELQRKAGLSVPETYVLQGLFNVLYKACLQDPWLGYLKLVEGTGFGTDLPL